MHAYAIAELLAVSISSWIQFRSARYFNRDISADKCQLAEIVNMQTTLQYSSCKQRNFVHIVSPL